jgi:hypothetical protein
MYMHFPSAWWGRVALYCGGNSHTDSRQLRLCKKRLLLRPECWRARRGRRCLGARVHAGERTRRVDLYYCVHSRGDAVYRDELEALSGRLPGLRVQLVCSAEEGHCRSATWGT